MSVLPSRPYFVESSWEDRHDPSRYEVEPIDTRIPSLAEVLADARVLRGHTDEPESGCDPYWSQKWRMEICQRADLLHDKLISVALGLSTTAEMGMLLDIVREVDAMREVNDTRAELMEEAICNAEGWPP